MTNEPFVCKLKTGEKEEVFFVEPINQQAVQEKLEKLKNKSVYVHLETTNGAYASHFGNQGVNVGAYIRNANVTFSEAKIIGELSYRVGLKTEIGWVYAEGLTDWVMHGEQLLLAGHDTEGRVMVALQISETPFE